MQSTNHNVIVNPNIDKKRRKQSNISTMTVFYVFKFTPQPELSINLTVGKKLHGDALNLVAMKTLQ